MDNSSEPEQDCNEGEDALSNVRRPMNAFFIFCKGHRDIVREKYPHLENRSITKILGEWWASLEPAEKASYTALAKQYKEAFMKAHPDFKWYKLPAPPARTLVTRPSNSRFYQNESSGNESENCGINLGKLVDDEQLGGLSSLINATNAAQPSTSTDCNNQQAHLVTEKDENILKPPKKRYIINGEFQSRMDVSSVDSRDYQTRDACTALLELAEICSSEVAQEMSSVSWPNNSNPTAIIEHRCPSPCIKTSGNELSTTTAVSGINSNESLSNSAEDSQQDEPLDLCKNNGKAEVFNETSKTITTSHQQLIDHFVDKFLCDKPSPTTKFYKSEIIDPSFCKLFSEKSLSASSSKDSKTGHSTFTLSVAIESAVDKAYSTDDSKSYSAKIPESNIVWGNQRSDNKDFNKQEFMEENVNNVKNSFDCKSDVKQSRKFLQWPATFSNDYTKNKHFDKPTSEGSNNSMVQNLNQNQTSKFNLSFNNSPTCSSSKYFNKLISPPKKSSVWCNLFMNEQQNNSSQHSSKNSNSIMDELPLSARRNSQRSCKGKRYQALLTEGLLLSHKERKQNCCKKPITSQNNSFFETHFVTSPKKKKKESNCKNKSSTETYGIGKGVFDLEERIASLPKCSFENLNKKKKKLETSVGTFEQQNRESLCVTSLVENGASNVKESTLGISSENHKTRNFDLEKQIAFLSKHNLEVRKSNE